MRDGPQPQTLAAADECRPSGSAQVLASATATSRRLTLHPFQAQVLRDERIFLLAAWIPVSSGGRAWRHSPPLYRGFGALSGSTLGTCRRLSSVAPSQELAVGPDRKLVFRVFMCR